MLAIGYLDDVLLRMGHQRERRLDAGRIYDRDLPGLTPAVAELVAALDRRTTRQWRPPWER